MLGAFLLQVLLMSLVLILIVPRLTGQGVAIREGGILRGVLVMILIAVSNYIIWVLASIATLGSILLVNVLTFGLVGVLVTAVSLCVAERLMPDTLQVTSFSAALWAGLILNIAGFITNNAAGYLLHWF